MMMRTLMSATQIAPAVETADERLCDRLLRGAP
jgi:hypothetical protein